MLLVIALFSLFAGNACADQFDENILKLFNSFTRNCELIYLGNETRYGLRATNDIHFGDVIMVVPPIYVLSTFEPYPWQVKFKSFSSAFNLVARLLYEKFVVKEATNRKLLIDTLPKTYSTVFTFTEQQKFEFGEYFGHNINLGLPLQCEQDYKSFIKSADKEVKKCKECMEEKNFFWACQAVLTRAYSFSKQSYFKLTQGRGLGNELNTDGSALIFGVDMFNHYPRPKVKNNGKLYGIQYLEDPSHVSVKSDREFSPGEEVFMTYGPKNNLELYIVHGFIIENNPDDFGLVGIPSERNDCENFSPKFQYCAFNIYAKELNADIVNYLYYRLTGNRINILEVSEVHEKKNEHLFGTLNKLAIFTKYRDVLMNFNYDRCRGKYKGRNRDSSQESLLERLCQESWKLYFDHLLRLDHLLLSTFYDELFKVS